MTEEVEVQGHSKGGNQSKGGDMEVDKPHEEVEKENQTPNNQKEQRSPQSKKKKRYKKKKVAKNAEFVKSN